MKKLFTLILAAATSIGLSAETYQLITNDGKLNSNYFFSTVTTVNSGTETFTEADESTTTWNYNMTFGSSRSTAYGQTSNLFEYSAKSTQTRVKIYTKADNNNRKVYVQEFVEGEVPSTDPGVTETFNLGAKDALEIFNYSSDNTKARTLYFFGNNGSIKICQIVIEEIGTPLPQGGEAGYATLLKNGRHAIKSGEGTLDGITYNIKSDLKPGNGGKGAVMRGATNYMKFSTSGTVVVKVKEANKKGYYFAKTKETYDDTKAIKTGDSEVVLRGASDWYIICNTSSDTQIDSIAFENYVASSVATLASVSVGENALDMSKFAEQDGALRYDYELPMSTTEVPAVTYTTTDANATVEKADADDVNGTTTLTVTAEDGTTTQVYKINFSVKASLGTDATLSSIKLDGVDIDGFAAETTEYNAEIGLYATTLPTITYTLNDPNASAVLTPAEAVPGAATIVVTPEDTEAATKTYTINFTRKAATELVAISGSTTWDWSKAGGKAAEFTDNTLPTRNEWFNFADVLPSPDESFKAASLEGQMQFANRNDNSYAQGYKLRFNTTVPGKVSVQFSNTGTKTVARDIYINGVDTKVGSKNDEKVTVENIAVPAGVVLIEGMEMLETPAANMLRFYKVIFTKSPATAISNTSDAEKAQKRIENGQLVIEKNGKVFNAMGQTIR